MTVLEKSETHPGRGSRGLRSRSPRSSDGREGRRGKRGSQQEPDFVPTLPSVDLLPAEVHEAFRTRRVRRAFLLSALGLLAAGAAVWLLQANMIRLAQQEVDDENATAAALAADLAALAPVRTYLAQIDAYQATIQTTMANEVLPSEVVAEVDRVAPRGVRVDSVGMTLATGATGAGGTTDGVATTSTCPSPDPFAAPVPSAGCVTISGRATSRVPVGELIDRLEANPMFTSVFVSTAAAGGDGLVTFTGSVGLAPEKAFSGRYQDAAFLGGDQE